MPFRMRMAMNGLAVALLAIVIAPAVAQASTELLVEYSGTYNETAKGLENGKTKTTTVSYKWSEQGTAPAATSERTAASLKSLSISDGIYSVLVTGSPEKSCVLSASKTFNPEAKLSVGAEASGGENYLHATAPLPTSAAGVAAENCSKLPALKVPNGENVEKDPKFAAVSEAVLDRPLKELTNLTATEPITYELPEAEDKVTITGELKAQVLLNIAPPVITIPKITIKSPTGSSSPGTSPASHVLSPAILSLAGALTGKPRASAASVRGITVRCPAAATRCQVTGTLTTVLPSRARAAATVNKRHRPASHAIVIGAKAVTVAGGHGAALIVKLSRRGRALLAAHHRLRVTLTVAIGATTRSGLVKSTRRFQLVLHKR
jgi:hypothetical protein